MLNQWLYEFRRARREAKQLVMPLSFMIMMTVLFPLAFGVDTASLSKVAPGLVWCLVLLVSIMMMESLFAPDFEEGLIAQVRLSSLPLWQYVVCKAAAHSMGLGITLILALPCTSLFLGLSLSMTALLGVTVLLGVPALSLIGAFAASLLLGVQRSGLLVGVLLVPFYAPVLIFSISVLDNARLGLAITPSLALLAAYSLFHCAVMPLLVASSLKAGEMG